MFKNIVLGVTGGVAAYKAVEIARQLRQQNHRVRVVMTEAAKQFVTPLLFQAVTGEPVSEDLFDPQAEAAMGHIQLAKWADQLLVAPATAHFIAKLAHGLADDLLSTLCLATSAPIFLAPAMNQGMWHAHATQDNVATCAQRGVSILGPDFGEQACGDVGLGRMLAPEVIVTSLVESQEKGLFYGKRIMITAGPTQEPMDPVRFISNHSSGKMGYALAKAARGMGAEVTLISGPVALPSPEGLDVVRIQTAQQMYDKVMAQVSGQDIFIGAAAVADFRCVHRADKKRAKDEIELQLAPNPDIVASVAQQFPGVFVVGFAAQTHDVEEKAREKLYAKGLDLIAANNVAAPGQGFYSDNNALTVICREHVELIELDSKAHVAQKLLNIISKRCGSYAETTS